MMDGPCVGGPYYLLCERVCVTGPAGGESGGGGRGEEGPYTCCASPGELHRTAGRIDLASRSAGLQERIKRQLIKAGGLYGGYSAFAPVQGKQLATSCVFLTPAAALNQAPGAKVSPLDAAHSSRLNVWLFLMRRPVIDACVAPRVQVRFYE